MRLRSEEWDRPTTAYQTAYGTLGRTWEKDRLRPEKEHSTHLSQRMLFAKIRVLYSGFRNSVQHSSRMFRDVGINVVLTLLQQLVQSGQERLDTEAVFYRRHAINKLVLKPSERLDSVQNLCVLLFRSVCTLVS